MSTTEKWLSVDDSRRLLRVVARKWRTVLVFALCGGVLGGIAVLQLSSNPQSTTTVFVTPLTASPFSTDPRGQTLTDLETEAQVVKSDAVLTRAADKLGNQISATKIEAATQVGIPAGSQVLAISFTESPPVTATAGSDAVAQAYLEVRQERAQQSIQDQLDAIQVAEKQTTKALRESARAVQASGAGSAARQVAEQQVAVAAGTLTGLAEQRSTLVATSTSPGEVLSPGSESSGSGPLTGAVGGLLLGALIGALWVVYRDVRRVADLPADEDQHTGDAEMHRPEESVYDDPSEDSASDPSEVASTEPSTVGPDPQ